MAGKHKRERIELVFNVEDRAEFLTGFSKRKKERKKVARMKLEKQYKEEVTRIKRDKRDRIKQRLEDVSSVKLSNGIELTQQLAEEALEQETVLDLPQHTVTITCAEEMDFSKCKDSAYLGMNTDDNDIEVVDMAKCDEPESSKETTKENKPKLKQPSKAAQRQSAARVASLAKKTQRLKTKRNPKVQDTGKIKKSKKKFLRKKMAKHKAKSHQQ